MNGGWSRSTIAGWLRRGLYAAFSSGEELTFDYGYDPTAKE